MNDTEKGDLPDDDEEDGIVVGDYQLPEGDPGDCNQQQLQTLPAHHDDCTCSECAVVVESAEQERERRWQEEEAARPRLQEAEELLSLAEGEAWLDAHAPGWRSVGQPPPMIPTRWGVQYSRAELENWAEEKWLL